MNKKQNINSNIKKLAIVTILAVALIAAGFGYKAFIGANNNAVKTSEAEITPVKDNDIVIQVKDITETPSFYQANINGTDLEVIAVKASDGTIRTAFNTCQVCYNSGKGYYEVEGNQLVCQNCGNRFGMDDIGVTKGGCNPVPITDEYKTISNENITISKDILAQALTIFQNWK